MTSPALEAVINDEFVQIATFCAARGFGKRETAQLQFVHRLTCNAHYEGKTAAEKLAEAKDAVAETLLSNSPVRAPMTMGFDAFGACVAFTLQPKLFAERQQLYETEVVPYLGAQSR